MSIDLQAVYRLKQNVLLAEFETAGVLFDLRSRRCLELNRTGIEIIGHMNGHSTLEQIIARLSSVYGLPESHLQKDLVDFIALLHEGNLLDDRQGTKDSSQG